MDGNMKYKRIGTIAKELDITVHTLRHWEHEGLIKPYKRGRTRYYQQAHLDRLVIIKHGLYTLGYTLKGMKKALHLHLIKSDSDDLPRRDYRKLTSTHGTKARKIIAYILTERNEALRLQGATKYLGPYSIFQRSPNCWTLERDNQVILGPHTSYEDLKFEIYTDFTAALEGHWGR